MNPPRYEVRETPPHNASGAVQEPGEWGVWDTLTHNWVWGERYTSLVTARERADTYNHAYERTL